MINRFMPARELRSDATIDRQFIGHDPRLAIDVLADCRFQRLPVYPIDFVRTNPTVTLD